MTQHALLVGIENFQSKLNSIAFAENDVNDFVSVLINSFELPYENIHYLTNGSATLEKINEEISEICENAVEGDRVILYFATHGMTAHNTTYLSAYDSVYVPGRTNEQQDLLTWIRIDSLLGRLHYAKFKILAFLDCCHSTQFSFGRSIRNDEEEVFVVSGSSGEYTAVFAAAGENEEAYPDPDYQHGCWTYYLIQALSGRAPKAFKDNTNRITHYSLQTYLKESVLYKMREHGKNQTPHFWGTYSDDIVIVEHPNTEGQRLKIKDIYFGSIDTDKEKQEAPYEDFLLQNFYDLDSTCEKLTANNGLQLIIGNKGSGKTYLGEYLEHTNENITYHSIGSITLNHIKNLTLAQPDAPGKYISAWTYALHTLLACIIVRENKPNADIFKQLLTDIYGNSINIILKTFNVAAKNKLFNDKIKRGVNLRSSFSAILFDGNCQKADINDLNMLYSYLFNEHFSNDTLHFLFDGLDEQIRESMNDDLRSFLLDLMAAVSQSNSDLQHIKLVLLFRKDLLELLQNEANKNKIHTGRSCTLNWVSSDKNHSNTPLYQFLEKRIVNFAKSKGITTGVKLEDILPSRMEFANSGSMDTWSWILQLTTHTPRDIVNFFNCCKPFAGEQHFLTQDNLWKATDQHSQYLWHEFEDIMAGTCLYGMSAKLTELFQKIAQEHNIRSTTKFSFSTFQRLYSQTEQLRDIPIADVLRVLYESGIMGVRTNSGTYWSFREKEFPFNYDIWKEAEFDIHKGLWKKFGIW